LHGSTEPVVAGADVVGRTLDDERTPEPEGLYRLADSPDITLVVAVLRVSDEVVDRHHLTLGVANPKSKSICHRGNATLTP
jgi:hypothetical protein